MNFHLQRLQNDITRTVEGLTPGQLTWCREGKWNTAEILEHLYLTYTGTIKGFERCLAAGQPLARPATRSDRIKTLVVVGFGYLPEGRQAPRPAVPRGLLPGLPLSEILSQTLPRITEMDAVIDRAIQAFGPDVALLDHPILGPLRGPEWCKFHWVHGHHHVLQIVRLRELCASSPR